MDLADKALRAKEWYSSLKTKLSLLPKKPFRIRMSRNCGRKMLTMTNLVAEFVVQLAKVEYEGTPFIQILKQDGKGEIRASVGKVAVVLVVAAHPVTTKVPKFM